MDDDEMNVYINSIKKGEFDSVKRIGKLMKVLGERAATHAQVKEILDAWLDRQRELGYFK